MSPRASRPAAEPERLLRPGPTVSGIHQLLLQMRINEVATNPSDEQIHVENADKEEGRPSWWRDGRTQNVA